MVAFRVHCGNRRIVLLERIGSLPPMYCNSISLPAEHDLIRGRGYAATVPVRVRVWPLKMPRC